MPLGRLDPTTYTVWDFMNKLAAKYDAEVREIPPRYLPVTTVHRQAERSSDRSNPFGDNSAKRVLDTKTGRTYDSMSKCAKSLAREYGLDPDNHFAWYKIKAMDPARFRVLD